MVGGAKLGSRLMLSMAPAVLSSGQALAQGAPMAPAGSSGSGQVAAYPAMRSTAPNCAMTPARPRKYR